MAIFNVRGFTLADLYFIATRDEKTAIKWCQDHDLLWQFPQCQLCGQLMQFKEQVRFSSCFCHISHSLRHHTFFAKSHLKISQILRLIYFWSMDRFQQVDYRRELGISSRHTVVDWKNFCRDICQRYLLENSLKIGGEGKVVEIDECLLVRSKHNVGRVAKEQWIFDGVEVGSDKWVMVTADRRNAETLLPIIEEL